MSSRAEPAAVRSAVIPTRLADFAARNSLLIVLVALLTSVLLALGPELLVADSWMTLVAGREIFQHGLPSNETLTVIPYGHQWTDQQWLGQVVFYAFEWLGGLRLAILLNVALVAGTLALGLAAARRRGASARSALFVASASVFVAPWSWQLRAQALALPLFVLVFDLASREARTPNRRTWLALPLIVLWANIHGSVLLGAGMVSLAGVWGLGRRVLGQPGAPALRRSAALVAAPIACLIASPYWIHLVGYYKLMLVTSPVSRVIVEWQAPGLHGYDLVFFGVAAATVVLALVYRRRVSLFDLAILAVTLAGSVRSSRGIVWFTLAVLVIAPTLVDGLFKGTAAPMHRRMGVIVGGTVSAVVLAILVGVMAQSTSWYEKNWPEEAAAATAQAATAVPGRTAVFGSDKHSDWLLWKEPSLRGRVAYDVRFELDTGAQLDDIVRFKSTATDWRRPARAYPILVLDPDDVGRRVHQLEREPGAKVLYRSASVVVISRPVARS